MVTGRIKCKDEKLKKKIKKKFDGETLGVISK